MSISLKLPENILLKPTITVFGVGGAGGNAVNNMIRSNLQGAKFVVANTDAQALEHSLAEYRIQLGLNTTKGLGAGASPDVGMAAAQESEEEILEHLQGSNMVFITAGMGGGTGTGAAPVIASLAKKLGILTVGVVTKPFNFEGHYRMKLADYGLSELQKNVDTLIVIPNQNLFLIANEQTTFADAFNMADDVLHSGVRGVTDLMIMPGLINLDFADIRAVMSEMGKAMMGTGEAANSADRAIRAAEAAISNPLLDHRSIRGAKGVLINITGGMDMTLFEVDAAANRIREEVGDNEANIIFGSTFNKELDGLIRVSVVATGIDINENTQPKANFFAKHEAVIAPITTNSFIETTTPIEEVDPEPEVQTFASETSTVETATAIEEREEEATEAHPQIAASIEKIIKTSAANEEHPKIISPIVPIKTETVEPIKPRVSLFSRMLNTLKSPEKQETHQVSEGTSSNHLTPKSDKVAPVNEQADIYDIPAFLRRNK